MQKILLQLYIELQIKTIILLVYRPKLWASQVNVEGKITLLFANIVFQK